MVWAVKRALATLVALLFLTVPLMGASAGDGVPDWLERTASEIASAKSGGTLVVTIEQPLAVDGGNVPEGMKLVVDAKKDHDVHLVVVQTGPDSGPGGAVLLLLADRRVVVDQEAAISRPPHEAMQKAAELKLCDGDRADLCQLLDRLKNQRVGMKEAGLPGADPRMDRDKQAALGNTSGVKQVTFPSGESADGPGFGVAGTLLTVLAAGTAVFGWAVLRTRYRPAFVAVPGRGTRRRPAAEPESASWTARTSGPPPVLPQRPPHRTWPDDHPQTPTAGPRAVPDGPVRPATVRTSLHPQGYVELDGWLYRASWAEPHLDAPAPDATVDVTGHRPGPLLAYAPADSRDSHA
ncbi:hypothetical protein [Streptomyces sp. GQFP]|uniref:hypothetical protein n=1 Tax=Streptomyces sp. GQFP TaxID=2907545 RepID=UPI001F427B15|nr:hypothetical protein [Streptomyces sp. GQFP]UIX35034.1 hypothetical protein LUX31_36335 [Streptomyces sp. GQFP]